jgi:hypothetical protein
MTIMSELLQSILCRLQMLHIAIGRLNFKIPNKHTDVIVKSTQNSVSTIVHFGKLHVVNSPEITLISGAIGSI